MNTALATEKSTCWIDSEKCPYSSHVKNFKTANFKGDCRYCGQLDDILKELAEVVLSRCEFDYDKTTMKLKKP